MVMQISVLAQALIDNKLIDKTTALTLESDARMANLDLADYLFYHTNYDSNKIAAACARYFDFEVINEPTIKKPRIDNHVIHFKQNECDAIALYRPSDFKYINADNTLFFTSAKIFYKLRAALPTISHKEQSEKTTIEQLNKLMVHAISKNASDIHFEPHETHVSVRLRIDGLLEQIEPLPYKDFERITTRLKVVSNTDLTQSRLPQDGRFEYTFNTQKIDCRISFCPVIYGEKIVVRLLNVCQHILQLNEIGLEATQIKQLHETLEHTSGLILVTGPTGSGKTQTLYTLLNYLNRATRNISTIEDPVEIKLPGINQIHINDDLGLTFPRVLRALLRQDPDIIMIGEIRDHDTADLAIRAAQTGHLVLATLHTQTSVDAIARLENLNITRFNIANTVKLIITQRLVRKCHHSGLKGRTGIFELLKVTPHIQQQITSNSSTLMILKAAQAQGFKTLYEFGLHKVHSGVTTAGELKRVGIWQEAVQCDYA